MDEIRIKNLEVFARHGVFEEEQRLGQKFVVDVVLYTDVRQAGLTDNLTKSIHYGDVSAFITEYMQTHTFLLIETVAEQLAQSLLLKWKLLQKVSLEMKKPWAPVGLPLETVSVRIERGWHTAYVALGSNMGDREEYLNQAVARLREEPLIQVRQVSSYMDTLPYGGVEQDNFLNGAMEIRTLLTAHELLDVLQRIEQEAHRVRLIHWGPRTLDLDILLFDDEIIGDERLVVPHPEMEKRDFVLAPMAEIAGWKRHPISKKTMQQLYQELTFSVEATRQDNR
ncbi:MAG: 2-amino-4-hydroxy-6-hydroxymethyldihydropteridine diphosphokinase [Lachnospiraceae bacterium]